MTLRPLGPDDAEQSWQLGRLAFGADPDSPRPDPPPQRLAIGEFDERGRLLSKASLLPYEQWWGGHRVPMGGVGGVAVHPDARGRGAGTRVVSSLLPLMQERGQAVSVLFPTAIGLYRPLGWEVVGALAHTRIPAGMLRNADDPEQVRVRTATAADVPSLTGLYDWLGVTSAGLLTRDGPMFASRDPLGADVVAVAEGPGGAPLGYCSYDRGRGYGPDAELHVHELVSRTGEALAALVRSLASWDAVVGSVVWRGPTDELVLALGRPVPPPERSVPWMLRIVDAAAAVAARGFAPSTDVDVSFALVDPDLPRHDGAWRLVVSQQRGALERTGGRVDLPLLHVRGLALLYAGAADTGLLLRAGLLDRPVPALDAAFAGPRPRLLDYF